MQSLSVKLLEELRVLSNLSRRGVPLVRLVLFGGPGLEDTFAAPELETFNQRLGARCYLSAMSYEETRNYVRSHVAAVGADPDAVFTPDGLDAVFHASDGVPRLVSQVCDRALVMAVAHSRPSVDNGVMQLAWSDLHQLPAPWNTDEPEMARLEAAAPSTAYAEAGNVEFDPLAGPLEEVDDAPRMPEWNADEALLELPSEEPVDEASPVTREVVDPFGDDFAEEEVVIDRFASLDKVFRPSTPVVRNSQDPTLGSMVRTFDLPEVEEAASAYESFNEDTLAELELEDLEDSLESEQEPNASPFESFDENTIAPAPLRLQAADEEHDQLHEQTGEDASDESSEEAEGEGSCDYFTDSDYRQDSPAATLRFGDTELEEPEESDVLVIENDLVEIGGRAVPTVRRREYRQLFAQLRRG